MRVVLTGRWARGRHTKSLVNSRLAANSQAPKLPKTHSPGDTGKGDRSAGAFRNRPTREEGCSKSNSFDADGPAAQCTRTGNLPNACDNQNYHTLCVVRAEPLLTIR